VGGCTAKWAGWLAGGCSPFIVRGAAGIGIGIATGVGVLHVACPAIVLSSFISHFTRIPITCCQLKYCH